MEKKKPGAEGISASAFCYVKCSQVKQHTDAKNEGRLQNKINKLLPIVGLYAYPEFTSYRLSYDTDLTELCYFRKKEKSISGEVN